MHPSLTRAWVDVDLGALQRNGAALAARGAPLLPMVKADAYGLGAVPVARALEVLAPWGYGVATVGEGAELHRAGITRPVVVFTPLPPTDLAAARAQHLIPALGSVAEIACWSELGGGDWHLGIDTGMNRAGVRWDEVAGLRELLVTHPPAAAFTHFHSADLSLSSVLEQEDRFRTALAALPVRPPMVHAEGSAVLAAGRRAQWDVVRPGFFLYGGTSAPAAPHDASAEGALVEAALVPESVVHLRARVAEVRWVPRGESVSYGATYRANEPRRVATLAIGYADGYCRALSNRGVVSIRGARTRVVGVVTMDMTMVDVTDTVCEVGDVATLIGRDGDVLLTIADVARTAEMSPYELLTGLRGRLEHAYGGAA